MSSSNRTDATQWDLPTFDSKAKRQQDQGYTNALGKPSNWKFEPPEEEPEEIAPKPPTLEEIEGIQQAAYDEGVAEGRKEGYQQGFEQGQKDGQEQGHQEGYQDGLNKGLEQGQQEIAEKVAQWSQLIDQLTQPMKQVDAQVENELVQLALALAKAVIQCEVKTNPQVILNSVRQAAEKLPFNQQACQLNINPEDETSLLSEYNHEILQKRNWRLVADPAITQGSVQMSSEQTQIDFSIEQRVQEVFADLAAQEKSGGA